MSTVSNANILGTKTGPQLVTEIATQFGNTNTELDARPKKAVSETIANAWTFSAGIVSGGPVVASVTLFDIRQGTTDAADNAEVRLSGGGAYGTARGAGMRLTGNENAAPGFLHLLTGDVALSELRLEGFNATSYITFYTNLVERMRIAASGAITTTGTVNGRTMATDGTKLDGIATGAKATLATLTDVNTAGRVDTNILEWNTATSKYIHVAKPAGGAGATNLSFSRTTTTVTVLSDTGTDAILPAADTNAGIMTAAMKTSLDNTVSGLATVVSDLNIAEASLVTAQSDITDLEAQVAGLSGTNLTYARDASSVTIYSSNGTDIVLPATDANAGIMTAAMKLALDNVVNDSVKDADFSVTGLCVRTAAGAYTGRTLQAGAGIAITNPAGTAGDPSISTAYTVSTAAPTGTPANGHVWYRTA